MSKLDPVREQAARARNALDSFPALVDDFLKTSGVAETRFGRDALNMPDFVRLLRQGRGMRMPTVKKALDYITYYGL